MPETLDAVRVMTMHKSKGCNSPSSYRGTTFPNGWTAPPWRRTGRADGAAPRGPASATHTTRPSRTTPEALHLLYVAWTRAGEEAYAS